MANGSAQLSASPRREVVLAPNLGVYLNRPELTMEPRALIDAFNVRIKDASIRNENMGWSPFSISNGVNLDAVNGVDLTSLIYPGPFEGPLLLIDQFFTRDGSQTLIFGTKGNLYRYNDADQKIILLTPKYSTGTVNVVSHSPTVIQRNSGTTNWLTELSDGDWFFLGTAGETDPAATNDWTGSPVGWVTIDSVDSDTQLTLATNISVVGTPTNQPYTALKLFTGTDLDIWSAETFPDAQPADEDRWYACNGPGHEIVQWDGSADEVTRIDSALGFTCKTIARFKNMLLYGDLLESGERKPQNIRNSAIANPENVTTDEASEFRASDGVDMLLGITPLSDMAVAYFDRSINLLQFVGPPVNFAIRTAVPGVGALSDRSVVDFGDYHEFVGPDTGYHFDGISLREVGGQVFREVLRKIDQNRLDQALSHIDEESGEVLWAIPFTTDAGGESGYPETGYVEHYLEEVGNRGAPITIRDFPATATGFYLRFDTLRFSDLTDEFETYNFQWDDRYFAASFPYNLFGTKDGQVFILGISDSQNGSDFTSYARFPLRPLWDGRRNGIVIRVEPAFEKKESVGYEPEIRLFTTDFSEGSASLVATQTFDLTHEGLPFVSFRNAGRFGQIEIRTEGANKPWTLSGYAIETMPAGLRP